MTSLRNLLETADLSPNDMRVIIESHRVALRSRTDIGDIVAVSWIESSRDFWRAGKVAFTE